jgi:DNA-binding MarR family transcriptional regulator
MSNTPSGDRTGIDSGLDIGILLGLAYSTFVDRLHVAMEAAGFDDLGSSFGYVFRALADRPLMLREVAERLGMTAQGALKIIDEMVERGYVERTPDPSDGRAKRLGLSRRGRDALRTARAFHASFEATMRADHGARRTATVRAVFEAIVGVDAGDSAAAVLRPL